MKTLITGFGPFGKIAENPSSILAPHFGRDHEILEVNFKGVDEFVRSISRSAEYDRIVCLGVAGKSKQIRFELFGRNVVGPTKDVRGERWKSRAIDPDAPPALASTLLDADTFWDHAETGSNEVVLSTDAGGYLCNFILYRLLTEYPGKVGFIHIPPFESMSPERQYQAILKVILQAEEV